MTETNGSREPIEVEAHLGHCGPAVEALCETIRRDKVVPRIWGHDYTVWHDDPGEIAHRLGWLTCPDMTEPTLSELSAFADEVRTAGCTHCLLMGMGGSSLAPEVFRRTFGTTRGFPDLTVLDSTHPDAVLSAAAKLPPAGTLFVVSTKSGGTVETLSFMKYFFTRVGESLGPREAGRHFAAITDAGSGLESAARELGFRKTFLNDPTIGGRYAALSLVGLVPAALSGVDVRRLLRQAGREAACAKCVLPGMNSRSNVSAWLGAVMAGCASMGRNKITFVTSASVAPFAAWVEQLIAESTGKAGRGILPVVGEELLPAGAYGDDRLFVSLGLDGEDDGTWERLTALGATGAPVVRIRLRDLYDLGAEFFRWEMATAVAGIMLGINPFNQPDVEASKVLSRRMVDTFRQGGELPALEPVLTGTRMDVCADFIPAGVEEALPRFLASGMSRAEGGDLRPYVAIQAYVAPGPEIDTALQRLKTAIQERFKVAVTVGYGPRFLHSTGQLHKGDAGLGLFVQLTCDEARDVPIPDSAGGADSAVSFGVLIRAQAMGDYRALLDAGRRVIRFHMKGEVESAIRMLAEWVSSPER